MLTSCLNFQSELHHSTKVRAMLKEHFYSLLQEVKELLKKCQKLSLEGHWSYWES